MAQGIRETLRHREKTIGADVERNIDPDTYDFGRSLIINTFIGIGLWVAIISLIAWLAGKYQ